MSVDYKAALDRLFDAFSMDLRGETMPVNYSTTIRLEASPIVDAQGDIIGWTGIDDGGGAGYYPATDLRRLAAALAPSPASTVRINRTQTAPVAGNARDWAELEIPAATEVKK